MVALAEWENGIDEFTTGHVYIPATHREMRHVSSIEGQEGEVPYPLQKCLVL